MSGVRGTRIGQCPEPMCKGEYVLRQDGRIRNHRQEGGFGGRRGIECPGSRAWPTTSWERDEATG
jgi:hypothetical protein